MSDDWSGRRVTQARTIVATWLPAPCGQCGRTVETDDTFAVGHKIARSLRPDLTWAITNWQPEHRRCSDRTGQSAVIAKARAEGKREAEKSFEFKSKISDDADVFPPSDPRASLRLFPSLPPGPYGAYGAQKSAIEPRAGLTWPEHDLARHAWLAEYAVVPGDASPPLWMSPVPADAVCSYASAVCTHLEGEANAIEWIEFIEGKTLRWWQRLAIARQLEHRVDGSLCHKVVIDSGPRRIGKSVRMRGVAMWRMANAGLFGERQVVVHTGSDVTVCRAMQKVAWAWARDMGWKVVQANGKEAIESGDGDEWLVRSQKAVYGWDTTLGMVDEGWDVEPGTVSEGLEPSTMERSSAQLHLTSTAHRLATSLMRGRISAALAVDDGQTLLLVWAAPAGADVGDPAVWRAASPHWTEDRRRMIAAKYTAALAGQADPEADDPDPMAGFVAQYLNVWRLTERRSVGAQVVDAETWAMLGVLPEDRAPDAAAIEGWFADGVTLALAWRDGAAAVVSASDHPDLVAAVTALKASGFRGRVTVGASLVDDPALAGVRAQSAAMRTTAAVVELARLLREAGLRHDAGEHLSGQVLAVRTSAGVDGPKLASKSRADAVKAAVWAVSSARTSRPALTGLVLPTGTRG